jgi:peptidoglycan/xylan/chitin deacetylase (PgdA/CDA1 family)
MTRRPGKAALTNAPRALYPAKAAVTRARSLAWAARRRDALPPRDRVRILFYHRVSDDRDELAVTPKRFREQMETLARLGARGVDLVSASAQQPADADSPRLVGISFDDAYRDVADNAVPVLRALGFSATLFVPTGIIDGRASFGSGDHPPLLSWDEVCSLDAEGVLRMEAHSITHPNLLTLDDDAARHEIAGSRQELERRLGRAVSAFAYPAGLASERETRLAREAGFTLAFTCEPGLNDAGADRFALHRTQVDARDSLLDFRAKVGGGHDASLPLRRVYRSWRFGAR